MKKPKQNPAEELQKSFARWDYIHEHGCNDPGWADGTNLNLVRTHILHWKNQIEAEYAPKDYPEVYHRPPPPEVPQGYMARADEIRARAKESLALYLKDKDYRFLLARVDRLDPKDAKRLCVHNIINYAKGLELAIQKDDLVTMRRHENPESYLPAFSSCAQRIRELKPPENEQLNFFFTYDEDELEENGETNEPDETMNDQLPESQLSGINLKL